MKTVQPLEPQTTMLSRRKVKGGVPHFEHTVNWSVVYRRQGDQLVVAPGYKEAARKNICFKVTWENNSAAAENYFHEYGICVRWVAAEAKAGHLVLVALANDAWRLAIVQADGSFRDAVNNRPYHRARVLGVVVSESEGMSREQLRERRAS